MPKAYLSPYLVFNGNCREAMSFYQRVMGGELKMDTYGSSPMNAPESHQHMILHATLQNDTLSFMAADTSPGNRPVSGNNISLSISGSDETHLSQLFHDLSEGGTVTMPLERQFWGANFGMLTDRFGVQWMFNIGQGL